VEEKEAKQAEVKVQVQAVEEKEVKQAEVERM